MEAFRGDQTPQVISDGDSKTISVLNQHQPYGSEVSITKLGHVQKRLGKRVRAVKKELTSHNKAPKERIKVLTSELKDARKLLRSAKAKVLQGSGRGRGRGSVLEEDGEPCTDAEMLVKWKLKHLKGRLSSSVQRLCRERCWILRLTPYRACTGRL